MGYNVQSLSFLIGSFNQLIQNFGENEKTVSFFRQQSIGLSNINQLNIYDVKLVFNIIGMVNTDKLKWEQVHKNINEFTNAMNVIESYAGQKETQRFALYELYKSEQISNKIYNAVCDIYQLEKITLTPDKAKAKTEKKFGVLPNVKCNDKGYLMGNADSELEFNWSNFCTKYAGMNLVVRVHNTEAVCSGDVRYFFVEIEDLLKSKLYTTDILRKHAKFEVGFLEEKGDGCHSWKDFKKCDDLTKEAQLLLVRIE